mmetsp:Transcript_31495/g.61859  ORF Transcript_31495/g.61859 Transcript_31495/m.61859 type:complete len:254 (+) Transcript_31495:49-810(+)
MKRKHDINVLFDSGEVDSATASLAGRELPSDLVQQVCSISMGQLFYLLGHIQKLSAQAPVTAQALLAEHPQLCNALLHAECLAGMIEEKLLPLTAEEMQRAKAKARRIREELEDHELPPPAAPPVESLVQYGLPQATQQHIPMPLGGIPKSSSILGALHAKYGFTRPPPVSVQPKAADAPSLHGAFCKASSLIRPPVKSATVAPQDRGNPAADEQKQHLLRKVVQLTPEQIGRLPEATKVELLAFLQSAGPPP